MADHVVLIRHGEDPPDDRVHTHFVTRGYRVTVARPYAGDLLGEPTDDLAGTVLYGGPYNVFETDRHPFLCEEHRWIGACLERGVPMLGICQGAQQIALHLGAAVGPKPDARHEFGYYRIDPAEGEAARQFLAGPMWFTQHHFHTFDIPDGGERLAGSELFENQAFRYGERVYGLQFHPEVTIEGFRRWQAAPWSDYSRPGVQQRGEQDRLMHEHDAAQAAWFTSFLEGLFDARRRPT